MPTEIKTVNQFSNIHRRQDGFTLIEVIVASVVLLVGVLSVVGLLNAANGATSRTKNHDTATNLARELIEGARSVPYEKVSSPGVTADLQKLPGLEDIDGGAYTVKREGLTFTVTVDVCVMDDPKDGGGTRATTATFCSNSTPAGTADKNPEDYKRVTVTASWKEGARTRKSVQTGIINNPGSASGPAVRSIVPRGYTSPYMVTTDINTVTVDVSTSSKPTTMAWMLDGSRQQSPVTQNGSSGLLWQFDWNMKTLEDGAYVVAAEAYDAYGVSGPSRQETVVLNRFPPKPPKQVAGGRTKFNTVEVEWAANSERDIIGYQVFRVDSGSPVCDIATQKLETFCVDNSPPDVPVLEYYVRAYDRDPSGNVRASTDSTHIFVTQSNNPPYKVENLALTKLANGDTKLTWTKPSPEDPDTGDSISFYRIYRDGIAMSNRYERYFDSSGSPTVTWTDINTNGVLHSYWVTSVDQNYAESGFGLPVIG